jgi:hypothetical protein
MSESMLAEAVWPLEQVLSEPRVETWVVALVPDELKQVPVQAGLVADGDR